MSKLDKDKVLADYTAAYKKAHGKAPSIEAKSGWYSVNGGKNVRLAQLAEEAETLTADQGATPAKKDSKPKAPAKPKSKPAAKKATVKSGGKGGLTAKELWQQKLAEKSGNCRLPRGS
ncbi:MULTISPECIES: hypothetical protein [unclassified Idiomarina]|uniref:hypothetical protein n=1 Tax=unclassified Idiomarina TaxID=2614829 RepID=UPI000C96D1BE|nr:MULTISPECIES: hypothetical protein [unclassified Idiomarina]MAD54556.1 hypothetical protein [Idiomarinaceae bacterium]MEC7643414.1 hypothetical protein [Pseudomonadota bacterium]NQZ04498.1 hypothetical protein [Idiomarina sp.]|tara:strand:+ start:106 stop:459 length:354 start_codon:yes stop_codon:yes gene_type:complete